ncbi:MAG TPA: WD40 repeat domain-containing protein [Planctomycetota bacterium]|nr:WD40 repeat domain-containing protein [Planctomycetota bacterium]
MRILTLLVALAAAAVARQDPAPTPKEPETIVHRLGDLQWQHGSFISAMQVLPGEKQALTAGYNGGVVLWDLETGARVRTFWGGHEGEIMSLAVLPGGKGFATGGMDGKVAVWDLGGTAPRKSIQAFKAPGMSGMVRCLVATSDGARLVATGAYQQPVVVLDPEKGAEVRSISIKDPVVSALSVHPKVRQALVGFTTGATLYDLDTGDVVKQFELPKPEAGKAPPGGIPSRGIEGMGIDPAGGVAYALARGLGMVTWDIGTGAVLKTMPVSSYTGGSSLFSPDGKRFAAASYNRIEVWDIEKSSLHKGIRVNGAYRLDLIRDGKVAVIGTMDGALVVWDVEADKKLSGETAGPIGALAVSPDGRFALAGTRDGVNKLWNLKTGALVRTFEPLSPKKYGDGSPTHNYASAFEFSADGRRAASGHWDCRSALWDVETGKAVREWSDGIHGTSVRCITFSPDGRRVAAPSVICDVESGEVLKSFDISRGAQTAVVFTPDGSHVVTGGNDETIRVRDASTGAIVREMKGAGRVVSMALSLDGKYLVTGTELGGQVQLWDFAEGKAIRSFQMKSDRLGSEIVVALSPDGRCLYTGSPGGDLLAWDLETAKIVKKFEGHLSSIKAIACSAGGRFVTTGSMDSMVLHRHPGLPYKAKSQAWAEAMKKDPEQLEKTWKRFTEALRSPDYDVWVETMERGVALGDSLPNRLYQEFGIHPTPIRNEKGDALLKDLDHEEVETRDKARRGLTDLGEPAYGWAREKMNDPALGAGVRAALKSFCRDLEARPLKPLEMKDIGELRAVLILLEQPESEKRAQALEQFAKGPMNSVPARLARRHVDQVLRR